MWDAAGYSGELTLISLSLEIIMKLTIENLGLDERFSAALSIMFARGVQHIFQDKNPEDVNLTNALEHAVIRVLDDVTEDTEEANDISFKCYKSGDGTDGVMAYAAYSAGNALDRDVDSAGNAASYAINGKDGSSDKVEDFFHNSLLAVLPLILRYKIEDGSSFTDGEAIYNLLSEEDQELFVFNLSTLR